MIPWQNYKCCAPTFDISPTGGNQAVNSDQAYLRHTKMSTYCCFLPDLTGFMDFRCVGPNHLHHLPGPNPTSVSLGWELNPATAVCGLQGTATSPSSTANLLT